MRILIPVLAFDNTGGYRVLSKLADQLIFLGHEVCFLAPGKSDLPYFPTTAKILWINEKGSVNSEREESDLKENAFSIQKKLVEGLRTLKNSFDIILANHSLTVLPIKRAGLLNKTVYYVQAYEPEYFKKNLKGSILGYLSQRSYNKQLFTIVNSDVYSSYKKLSSKRILYPGIDDTIFHPQPRHLFTDKNRIIIGTIARKEPYKGTRYIIEAFSQLKKKYKNLELHLAFAKEEDFKNLEGIFCFEPHGDKSLADFYRSLDYYVCAAYAQLGAFHYPVSEAMSCGVPVITTNYYPADETNAWIIKKTHDVQEIVVKFEEAEKNVSLKEKKIQNALSAVKQFNWKEVGLLLNEYLNQFMDQIAKA